MRTKLALATLFLVLTPLAHPQAPNQQAMDPDYAAKVKEWTTKAEFLSPLVDHLPLSATVPSPKEDPRPPHRRAQKAHLLRRRSPLLPHPRRKISRVKLIDIGKTDEGRDCLIIVFVGSEDSIKNLDTNRKEPGPPRRPARPHRRPGPASIIAHSQAHLHPLRRPAQQPRLGPPEMLMELAYRLVDRRLRCSSKRSATNVVVADHARSRPRRPRPLRRLVQPLPHRRHRHQRRLRSRQSPTGASTLSTTTTATSTTPA